MTSIQIPKLTEVEDIENLNLASIKELESVIKTTPEPPGLQVNSSKYSRKK